MYTEDQIWDSYNTLCLSHDLDRFNKILARSFLLNLSLNVPGDIVECGVYKGTGLMQLLKMRQIFIPNSIKKVIGFDLFQESLEVIEDEKDRNQLEKFHKSGKSDGISVEDLYLLAEKAGMREHVELVAGDICKTAPKYVEDHPGFRISYLYLDMDVAQPTKAALEALYERVTRGGVVVFDEYAIGRWSESEAVDEFFKDKNVQLLSIPWAKTPSAYLIKE